MESVCRKRLVNEVAWLEANPQKGTTLENVDLDKKCLQLLVKNRRISFEFSANYPFEPPTISNEVGMIINVKEVMIYSLNEILREVTTKNLSISSVFEVEDDPYVVKIMAREKKRPRSLHSALKLKPKAGKESRWSKWPSSVRA